MTKALCLLYELWLCTGSCIHCPSILSSLQVQLLNNRQPQKWSLCRHNPRTKSKSQSKANDGRHQMHLTLSFRELLVLAAHWQFHGQCHHVSNLHRL